MMVRAQAFLAGAFLAGAFLAGPSWPAPSWRRPWPAPSWRAPSWPGQPSWRSRPSWRAPSSRRPSWRRPWPAPSSPAPSSPGRPSWPGRSGCSLRGRGDLLRSGLGRSRSLGAAALAAQRPSWRPLASFGSFLAPEMTFFRSGPGMNFGTAVFLALIRAPVCGLRTHRASRIRFSTDPDPVIATFSPFATSRVMVSRTASSACAAALRFPS